MGIKSDLLIQATKYNNKGIVKFTLGLFNVLDKLFSFAKKRTMKKHLNDALVPAIENLNYDIVELLVNAGADVNSLDKNNKNAIVHAVERLAISKGLSLAPSKNLPEEIVSHPIVQFLLMKGSEYYDADSMDIEGKPVNRNVNHSLQPEPIYEEIPARNTKKQFICDYAEIDGFGDDGSGYSSTKEFRAQKKSIDSPHIYAQVALATKQGVKEPDDEYIYEEIDHFREDNSSLDSGYSSIEECATQQEPIYAEISNPLYAKVDPAAKRSERKAKSIKADSGTYHGLVKDRTNQWEEKINENKSAAKKADSGVHHGLVKDRTNQWEERINKQKSSAAIDK